MRSQVIRTTRSRRGHVHCSSSVTNDMKFVLKRKDKYYFGRFGAAVAWLVIPVNSYVF